VLKKVGRMDEMWSMEIFVGRRGKGRGEGGMGLVFVSFLLVWFIFEWGKGARVSFFISFVEF